MKVGMTLFFQNYLDWERYSAQEWDQPPTISDSTIYDEELPLGDLAEPLGFDSIWTVEHHHTPYTMIPNPTQLLSYYAGRTSRVDVGTMVMVLPWHHPLHVAEDISLLDNLLQGRLFHVGFGRGASAKEYDPLGIPMEESRQYFLESLDIVRKALTTPRFSFDGKVWNVPTTSLRPTPRSDDLVERMYCAWGSPQTLPIVAQAGLGLLIIPMKPWEDYIPEIEDYNAIRSANGLAPSPRSPSAGSIAMRTRPRPPSGPGLGWATISIAPLGTTGSLHQMSFAAYKAMNMIRRWPRISTK